MRARRLIGVALLGVRGRCWSGRSGPGQARGRGVGVEVGVRNRSETGQKPILDFSLGMVVLRSAHQSSSPGTTEGTLTRTVTVMSCPPRWR